MRKIVSVITARGGSKGIPLKNLVDVCGQPLIYYSIKESLKSNVDETWVSTDSSQIGNISQKFGAKIHVRPDNLAGDIIMPDETLVHFAKHNTFDLLVFIQPTSPMIKYGYINKGINMMESGKYDSVFTVTKEHWLPRWNEQGEPIGWKINERPRRQDRPHTFIENGMFYITTRDNLLDSKLRYTGKIGFVEIPIADSFQVDNTEDLELVRKII